MFSCILPISPSGAIRLPPLYKMFANEEELKAKVLEWFPMVGTLFYTDGMNKLLLCYVTKNVLTGMAIMWKNKDYRSLWLSTRTRYGIPSSQILT